MASFHRLMEHEGDPDIDEPYVPPVGNVLGGSDPQLPSPAAQPTAEGADPGKWSIVVTAFCIMVTYIVMIEL